MREAGRLKFLLDNWGARDADSPNPLLPMKARLLRISPRSTESSISVYAKIAASHSERPIERGKSRAAGERELKKTNSELTNVRS